MAITFEQRIGSLLVRVEGDDIKQMIEAFGFMSELPDQCPICHEETSLQFRMAKGYRFYGMSCKGAHQHGTTFGQYKEGGILFYKGHGSWADAYGADPEEADVPTGYGGGYGGTPTGHGPAPAQPGPAPPVEEGRCDLCSAALNRAQATLSRQKFGRLLCPKHQAGQGAPGAPGATVGQDSPQNGTRRATNGPGGGNGVHAPAPAPPRAAPAAPPVPAASEEQRTVAIQWVDYVYSLNTEEKAWLAPDEYSRLVVELSASQPLGGARAEAIIAAMETIANLKDAADQAQAAQGEQNGPPPGQAPGAAGNPG